jgi:hypothetical protein
MICTKTFNWLNSEKASALMLIAKNNKASSKRLAQQRGSIGVCKVTISLPMGSMFEGNGVMRTILAQATEQGLINSLTF